MTREYFLEGSLYQKGGLTIKCKDVIYTFICEEEHNSLDRPCKYFKESDTQ